MDFPFQYVPLQGRLIGELIGLARATEGNEFALTAATRLVTARALLAALSDPLPDDTALLLHLEQVDYEKRKLVPDCYHCTAACGRTAAYDLHRLEALEDTVRSLKIRVLFSARALAARICQQEAPESLEALLYKSLYAVGMEDWQAEELLPLLDALDTAIFPSPAHSTPF